MVLTGEIDKTLRFAQRFQSSLLRFQPREAPREPPEAAEAAELRRRTQEVLQEVKDMKILVRKKDLELTEVCL